MDRVRYKARPRKRKFTWNTPRYIPALIKAREVLMKIEHPSDEIKLYIKALTKAIVQLIDEGLNIRANPYEGEDGS